MLRMHQFSKVELVSIVTPEQSVDEHERMTDCAQEVLKRLGLHHQVALVGFDDILLADLLDPGITVMAQDPAAMGRTAAELLFRRLDGDQTPMVHQVIPTRLIERGSGEIGP